MTGEAMRMRMQLARLAQQHRLVPKSFAPTELLPPIDGDVIVAGLVAPAVIDNERTMFAAHCHLPIEESDPRYASPYSFAETPLGDDMRTFRNASQIVESSLDFLHQIPEIRNLSKGLLSGSTKFLSHLVEQCCERPPHPRWLIRRQKRRVICSCSDG